MNCRPQLQLAPLTGDNLMINLFFCDKRAWAGMEPIEMSAGLSCRSRPVMPRLGRSAFLLIPVRSGDVSGKCEPHLSPGLCSEKARKWRIIHHHHCCSPTMRALVWAYCSYMFMQSERKRSIQPGLCAVLFLSMLGKQIEGEVEPCSTRYIHNEMRLHWSGYPEVMH